MEKNPYTRTALIELEGIGASGKSTLFKMLGHYLESLDIRYASFKQPWFPSGLDEELDKDELLLKQVIYSPENVEDKDMMSLVEIQKGITRQRGRMFQQVLIPALEQGEIEVALLDRCWLSTVAYGPATTALTRKDIILWHEALPGFFIADLALFLDLSTKISMKRSKKRWKQAYLPSPWWMMSRIRLSSTPSVKTTSWASPRKMRPCCISTANCAPVTRKT